MRRLIATAFVSALFVAGCGGGDDEDAGSSLPDSDQVQIEMVTEQLVAAAKAKDGPRMCGVLQPSLVEEAFGSEARCAKMLLRAVRENAVPSELRIESFEATETGAEVTFEQERSGTVTYIKENGAWYIDLTSLAAEGTGGAS